MIKQDTIRQSDSEKRFDEERERLDKRRRTFLTKTAHTTSVLSSTMKIVQKKEKKADMCIQKTKKRQEKEVSIATVSCNQYW